MTKDLGQSGGSPPQHYVVEVMIVDRYWSVALFIDDETPDGAVQQAQGQFDEAVKLGYVTGAFRATSATPVEEFLS